MFWQTRVKVGVPLPVRKKCRYGLLFPIAIVVWNRCKYGPRLVEKMHRRGYLWLPFRRRNISLCKLIRRRLCQHVAERATNRWQKFVHVSHGGWHEINSGKLRYWPATKFFIAKSQGDILGLRMINMHPLQNFQTKSVRLQEAKNRGHESLVIQLELPRGFLLFGEKKSPY